MTRTTIVVAAALALALAVSAVIGIAPAHAQNGTFTRSFVSSAGSDSNPCTITQPCATFAHAYTAIGANGIVAALDPGKYGPLIITGPVTINGNGWAAITGPSGGTAITINASSGNVTLTGLEIDGAGTSSSGIVFNSGGSLNVRDSLIQNFGSDGIAFGPNASTATELFVSNTLVSDNGFDGIGIQSTGSGTVTGVLDHVAMENNANSGLDVFVDGGQTVTVTVSDSVIANNQAGIVEQSNAALAYVAVRRCNISNNGTGVDAITNSIIRLSQSQITGNVTGWMTNGGSVGSTFDNLIDDNTNGNGNPPTLAYK